MAHSVIINLGCGNLSEGFPMGTVGLREANNPRSQQIVGSLTSAPNLVESYRNWRLIYQSLCDRFASKHMIFRFVENCNSFDVSYYHPKPTQY